MKWKTLCETLLGYVLPGNVFMFTGLYNIMQSEDALAAVTEHEMTHVRRQLKPTKSEGKPPPFRQYPCTDSKSFATRQHSAHAERGDPLLQKHEREYWKPTADEPTHKCFALVALAAVLMGLVASGCTRSAAPRAATAPESLVTATTDQPPSSAVRLHPGLPQDSAASAVAPNLLSARAALALVKGERDEYWLNARREVYRSAIELTAQDETEKLRGQRVDKVLRGPVGRHEIALTFDDGPHPDFTPKLLEILKQSGIHATFFVVGEKAEEYPNLIRAEAAAGDTIGNHTYDHVSLVKIPLGYVATEIRACGDVVRSITGKTPTLFRPPGGQYNSDVARQIMSSGYRLILYSDDPGDYAEPGTGLIEARTLDRIGDGGIILLHDGSEQTLTVLPQLIARLKARGFRFVTVDQMLRNR